MRSATLASIAAETYPGPPNLLPAFGPGTRRQALTTNPAGTALAWAKVAPELLFQPGGVDDELVFTDFTQLCAYAATLPQKTIRFDFSIAGGDYVLPAGAYDFGPYCTWIGNGDQNQSDFLDISDGVTFASLPVAIEGYLEIFAEGAVPWTITASTSIDIGPNVVLDGSAVTSLISVTNNARLTVHAYGQLGDGADGPVFTGDSTGGLVLIAAYAGSSLRSNLIDSGNVAAVGTILGEGVTVDAAVFGTGTFHYARGVTVVGTGTPNFAHTAEVAGVFFWSTDQRLLYVTNGTAWQVVPQQSFIFSPNGTDAPGVFTSFAALCAVLLLLPGEKTIEFDLSHAGDNFTFPAGPFNHGINVTWKGIVRTTSSTVPTLTFANGTQITTCPTAIENLNITVTQAGLEVVVTPVGNATRLEYRGSQGDALLTPQMKSSSSPFVGITTGSDFDLVLRGTAEVLNNGAPAILDHGIATNITIRVFDAATIAASAISLQGADRPIIGIDSPAVNVDYSYAQFVVLQPGCPWAASGVPETVVPGIVGCLYCDKSGGAGTTFYVKESGSAKAGWAGK